MDNCKNLEKEIMIIHILLCATNKKSNSLQAMEKLYLKSKGQFSSLVTQTECETVNRESEIEPICQDIHHTDIMKKEPSKKRRQTMSLKAMIDRKKKQNHHHDDSGGLKTISSCESEESIKVDPRINEKVIISYCKQQHLSLYPVDPFDIPVFRLELDSINYGLLIAKALLI